jgi:glycosyltransferase involved in cell wall biosynthesis
MVQWKGALEDVVTTNVRSRNERNNKPHLINKFLNSHTSMPFYNHDNPKVPQKNGRSSQPHRINCIYCHHPKMNHLNHSLYRRSSHLGCQEAMRCRKARFIARGFPSPSRSTAMIGATKAIDPFLNHRPRMTHVLKNAAAIPDLSRGLIRRSGGIKLALIKGWRVFQREGLAGVSGRLTSFHQESADYQRWIHHYDTLTDEQRGIIQRRIEEFDHKPLISVVMPTYNTETRWLVAAIESVRRQLYPNWELCIADDASTEPQVRPILENFAKEDGRIKLTFRTRNGHISTASNSALKLASGEYITFLDHDDLLAEHALFWVVDAITHHPDAQLIYSDEDKIDMAGRRVNPYFKCDWNEDLFCSHNMICHLSVYRSKMVHELGGLREGLEGAQDYDLALRCIERIEPHQIVHIPRVLYHWRIHPGSTACGTIAKPYALKAGEIAINEHLQRSGSGGVVEPLIDLRMYRVRYPLPKSLPMVSLIIPSRNGLRFIRQCVESILRKTTYQDYEIVIVDNGSDDTETLQYFESLKSDPRVRIIRDDRPFNFSALINAAVTSVSGSVIGLVNNDIEVISPEWLSEMVSHALRPEVGAVGARLWYPNETLQHAGIILGIRGIAGHAHKYQKRHQNGYFARSRLIQSFCAVTAACLVIRKETFKKVGGFNEALPTSFNDVDFCLRVREAGYRNIYTPYAELYHHESATRGNEDTEEEQIRFSNESAYMKQLWGHLLMSDPAYSPNLTLEHQDFSLAWPPRVHPADRY